MSSIYIGSFAATREEGIRCCECDSVIRLGVDLTVVNTVAWLCRRCARLIAHDIEKKCSETSDFDSVYC